jgi:putative membrane-bound dehydrogenase-like protein
MNSLIITSLLAVFAAEVEFPKVLDDRLQLQLVAAEPEVVTPTGIAVDDQGRVLVIESHTHFRPEGYQGPPADRILLLDDFDPLTGKARRSRVFFEGTTHTMNLAVYHDGSIYVATRMEVFRLRDTDGDGRADERTPICRLDTPGNYPHNGLSGLAFDFAGHVYIGFGENLGAEYKLIGSDGRELAGGGEGGNIYCCDADGKNLRRVATGFWNPFGLGFDAFGRLFAVDNDPDSRPPCRLLHIVEGGDYGFRFRNGRKGVHPFTAWNGELPGTLPMVSGTGEAPCAVLAYESDNLPEEYRGDLLVTSWGDHRLERYRLQPRGASFSAEMTPVLLGTQNFRPVGLALAPDGSLYMSDWVDKSYPLHGKGRVWRLSAKSARRSSLPARQWDKPLLSGDLSGLDLKSALSSTDPFVRQAAVTSDEDPLSRINPARFASNSSGLERLSIAIAKRRSGRAECRDVIPLLLRDSDPQVQIYGLVWIGEERLSDYRPAVEDFLRQRIATRQLFEVALATLDRLSRGTPANRKAETPGEQFVVRLLHDRTADVSIRRFALRSLPPDHPQFTVEFLTKLLADADPALRLEAIRTLRQRPEGRWWPPLREIAMSNTAATQERCEAIVSLSPGNASDRKLLLVLAEDNNLEVADEALRALRGFDLTPKEQQRITQLAARLEGPHRELAERVLMRNPPPNLPKHEDLPAWLALAEGDGNREVGERIFYHPRVGGCFRCHEFEGRGYTVGADLSTIGRAMTRERLIQSIVDPSREIAPQFTAYTILTHTGEVLTGLHVGDEVDGRIRFADQNGRTFHIHPNDIERRVASSQSIMPDGLADNLTPQEIRDLVAFLLRDGN